MTTNPAAPGASEQSEPIPVMQRLLDNPLLLLGVAVPTVLYTLWSVNVVGCVGRLSLRQGPGDLFV